MIQIGQKIIDSNLKPDPEPESYDFFQEFSESVETFDTPEDPAPEKLTEPEQPEAKNMFLDESENKEFYADIAAQNSEIGRELVEAADLLLAFLIAMFVAKDVEKSDRYQLPTEAIDRIAKVAAKLMPQSKTIMPPSVELGVVIMAAYAPIIMQANLDRREKEIFEQERQRRLARKKKKRIAEMKVERNNNNLDFPIDEN